MSKDVVPGTLPIGNSSSTPAPAPATALAPGPAPIQVTTQSHVPITLQQPNLTRPVPMTHSDGGPPIINIPAVIPMPQAAPPPASIVPTINMNPPTGLNSTSTLHPPRPLHAPVQQQQQHQQMQSIQLQVPTSQPAALPVGSMPTIQVQTGSISSAPPTTTVLSAPTPVPVSLPMAQSQAPPVVQAQVPFTIASATVQQTSMHKTPGQQIQVQKQLVQQTPTQKSLTQSSIQLSGPGSRKNNNKRKRNTDPGNFSGNKNSIHGRMQTAASSVQRSLEKTCIVAERWCNMEPVSAKKIDSDKLGVSSSSNSSGSVSYNVGSGGVDVNRGALAPVSMSVDPTIDSSSGSSNSSSSNSSSSASMDNRSEEEIFRALQGAINAANTELVALKRKLRISRVENSMAIGFLANPVHFNEKCIGFKFSCGTHDKGPLGHRTKQVCNMLEELFVSGFTPHESHDGNIPKRQRTLKEVSKEKYSSYKFTKMMKTEGMGSNEDMSSSGAAPDGTSNTAA